MFGINGLSYKPRYITDFQQELLIQAIDEQPWRTALSRRTQHYGYIYDLKLHHKGRG